MAQQILLVHGGETFATYDDYIQYLEARSVALERMKPWVYWKTTLQEDLGDAYEVLSPSFPCKDNAKYREWKIHFERILPLLSDGVILVGHSLGGNFLAKYLSENDSPIRIRAALLLAAPYEDTSDYSLADFALPASLERFAAQAEQVILFHSKDDPVVPFADLAKYRAALPNAVCHELDAKNHFLIEEFPELIDALRTLQ
jgi:predicted alpha/beta hydrolase family esterase